MNILAFTLAASLATGLLAGSFAGCLGGTCHTQGDCSGSQSCEGPDEGPSCGIAPQRGCSSSADCGNGEVCSAVTDPCSDSGFGSACQPPCTGDADCGAELLCNAQHACQPIPCGTGSVTCPSYQRCEPASAAVPVWSETSGCTSISCQADTDCPATDSCVNAVCQSGPGHCETPVAVP